MRLLIILSFCLYCSNNLCSQIYSVERNLTWNGDINNISFFEESLKDSLTGSSLFFEAFSFQETVSAQFIAKEWDTIHILSNNNLRLLSDSFSFHYSSAPSRNNYICKITVNPICRNGKSGSFLRLKSFKVLFKVKQSIKSKISNVNFKNSVLASGKWSKIRIKKNGVYKVSFAQLKKMGFANPEKVRLYGYSGEMLPKSTSAPSVNDLLSIPVLINGDNILFYGQGADVWKFDAINKIYKIYTHDFSEYSYYYFSDNSQLPLIIQTVDLNLESTRTVQSFDDFDFQENDDVNFLKSGSEWYGKKMTNRQQTSLKFSFSNIDITSPAKVFYNIVSRSGKQALMTIKAESAIDSVLLYSSSQYGEFGLMPVSSNINVIVSYYNNIDASAAGYIDYVGVNVRRNLIMSGNQMVIRDATNAGSFENVKYVVKNANTDISVWDITNVNQPKAVNSSIIGSELIFYALADTLRTFVLFNLKTGLLEPENIDESAANFVNQNIHGADVPDLIIVTPDSQGIYDQAKRLAQFRIENDKFKVLLVKVSEVYNEFSGGKRDVTAIRNMAKYFYDRGKEEGRMLSYLLLFGDGTYVNKIDFTENNNLLPTYQSEGSLISNDSYVTDDYFGWMNYNADESENLLDIAVGRLPVKNYSEAGDVVNKIISYSNPANDEDWRNVICFIADDEDGNTHIRQADGLAREIESEYQNYMVQKIYLDAFYQIRSSSGESYPGVVDAINNRVNSGALIVNYTGHGNERQLAHENIINVKTIRSWANINKLPLFITATCEFSRWDDFNFSEKKVFTSAGEEVLLNPHGGAIALLTTTRLVYSSQNNELNKSFYNFVFTPNENGDFYRLGDAFRLAKNMAASTGVNRLNFTLLGDPSMMLAFPKRATIRTDSINGRLVADISLITDTIRALSVASVAGHIEDVFGGVADYSGNMSITVLDKPDTLTTLVNDPDSKPFTFTRQEGALFKGLVNVTKGNFSFKFPVPADIKYNFNTGRILFYAPSPDASYTGYYNKIIIGGLEEKENEGLGPKIKLYMNDTNFVNGGITNNNPILLVKLSDENGINASGIGIGHDITAILNDDYSQIYNLNGNYRTTLNDYMRGESTYAFTELLAGIHTVKVTSWDVFNNSSEASLTFRVVGESDVVLNRISNYPNPMSNFTNFSIEHNVANEEVTVEIYIYSFTGGLVSVLKYNGLSSGFRTPPLRWNGIDTNGHRAGNGIYPYRVIMKNKNGFSAQAYGKLLIMH